MNLLPNLRTLSAGLLLVLATVQSAWADPSDLLFTVKIDGDANVPTIHVTNNSPNLEITRFEFTIGNTAKNFDGSTRTLTAPPGGTVPMSPGANGTNPGGASPSGQPGGALR